MSMLKEKVKSSNAAAIKCLSNTRICAKSYRHTNNIYTLYTVMHVWPFNVEYDSCREHYVSSYVCFAYGLWQNTPLICLSHWLVCRYIYAALVRAVGGAVNEFTIYRYTYTYVEMVRVEESHFMRSECAHKCRTLRSGGFCILGFSTMKKDPIKWKGIFGKYILYNLTHTMGACWCLCYVYFNYK